MKNSVSFSKNRKYRYFLAESWGPKDNLIFMLLNPSTADDAKDDRTVAKCKKLAKELGYHGATILNLFAYCSTDPKKLKTVKDPVGEYNDSYIRLAMDAGDDVVLAYGNHGVYKKRHEQVLKILKQYNKNLYTLGYTNDFIPEHPLYIKMPKELQPYVPHDLKYYSLEQSRILLDWSELNPKK